MFGVTERDIVLNLGGNMFSEIAWEVEIEGHTEIGNKV
jgi:hypothetical protein